jgi:hypothetical protein
MCKARQKVFIVYSTSWSSVFVASDRRPHTLFDFKNESESKKQNERVQKRKTDYFIEVVLIG